MKILFTGTGSHHCKRPDNINFFSVLEKNLPSGAQVAWESPDINWTKEDLEKYDQIIFGFTPPTALSANKIYGALNVLGLMFDSPKLKLVVDSPQIWQYKNSISAILKNPDLLFTNFYSRRENFQTATKNKSLVEKAIAHMRVSEWPTIIYPSLPWNTDEKIHSALGFGNLEKIIGLNLDSTLIDPEPPNIARQDYWSLENPKSLWYQSLEKSIVFPVETTKVRRKTDDSYALELIKNGMGLILPPQDRTNVVWWNYRMIQAINTSTPIATNWQELYSFSTNWSVLAYQIEDMTPAQRQILASKQRNSYLEAIPSVEEARNILENILIESSIKERI